MHFARSATVLGTVPIVQAISRVAILLDLHDYVSGAQRMQPTAGQKDCVAGFRLETVQILLDSALLESLSECLRPGSLFEAGVDPRFRRCVSYKP